MYNTNEFNAKLSGAVARISKSINVDGKIIQEKFEDLATDLYYIYPDNDIDNMSEDDLIKLFFVSYRTTFHDEVIAAAYKMQIDLYQSYIGLPIDCCIMDVLSCE